MERGKELISCACYSPKRATCAYVARYSRGRDKSRDRQKATNDSKASKPTAEDAKTARKRRYML